MSGSLSDAEIEASRWIARLEAEDVSLEDHKRFRAWLAKSPTNRTAYEGLARTWDKLDALAYLDAPPPIAAAAPGHSRRWLLLGGAGAVAAAAAGVLAVPLITGDANATPYTTGVGERRSFALADGSTAELNADSALRVTMTARERRARLTKGEALFEVAHDAARPFIVTTVFGDVRAPGASFLVKLGTQSARVTVLTGSVEATRADASSSPGALVAAANEEIVLGTSGAETTPLDADAVTRRLSWRSGMIAFDGDTLADAALEIERQTGVRFAFSDPSIADLRVGGYISATDVEAFTALLESNLGLVAKRRGQTILLERRP
jgi:transmembrane sensor